MIEIGTNVLVLPFFNDIQQEGKVLGSYEVYNNGTITTKYRISFSDGTIGYYDEDEITLTQRNLDCTCGADRTYYPNPAPGHAYHCDITRSENAGTIY